MKLISYEITDDFIGHARVSTPLTGGGKCFLEKVGGKVKN